MWLRASHTWAPMHSTLTLQPHPVCGGTILPSRRGKRQQDPRQQLVSYFPCFSLPFTSTRCFELRHPPAPPSSLTNGNPSHSWTLFGPKLALFLTSESEDTDRIWRAASAGSDPRALRHYNQHQQQPTRSTEATEDVSPCVSNPPPPQISRNVIDWPSGRHTESGAKMAWAAKHGTRKHRPRRLQSRRRDRDGRRR